MRTTLDLDPAVLSVARAKAKADGTSIGRAVSELALAGVAASQAARRGPSGFPVMSGAAGHVVTDEMVAAHRDDD